MSEPATAPILPPTKPDAWGQLITAVTIVASLWSVAIGLVIVVGVILYATVTSKNADLKTALAIIGSITGVLGTVVGILGTALQAPSGIGNVVRAVVQKQS